MLIPLPLLMLFSTLTGQPVVVVIVPHELPAISIPDKRTEAEPAGCIYEVCKV